MLVIRTVRKERADLAEAVAKTVKTSLNLGLDLWREIEVYAARRGLTVTKVVDAALRKFLEEQEKERKHG